MTATPTSLPILPTSLVGSYAQPDWLIDRAKLAGRFPPRVRAKELWRVNAEYLEQAQDDATLLAAKAAASNVRTSLEAWPGLMHVFPLFSFALSEGRDALETASSFIRQYAGAATPEPMTADAL